MAEVVKLNVTLEVFLTKHPLQHWNTGQILKVNAGSHLKIEKKKKKDEKRL